MKQTLFISALFIIVNSVMAQESTSVEKNTIKSNNAQQVSGKKNNPHQTPEQKADRFMMKITEAVKMEDVQKTKVRSLALDHFIYMENVRQKAMGDKEKIKAEAKNSRKIFNDGLKKVLSPTQFETWKAKRKEAAKRQEMQPQPGDELKEGIED